MFISSGLTQHRWPQQFLNIPFPGSREEEEDEEEEGGTTGAAVIPHPGQSWINNSRIFVFFFVVVSVLLCPAGELSAQSFPQLLPKAWIWGGISTRGTEPSEAKISNSNTSHPGMDQTQAWLGPRIWDLMWILISCSFSKHPELQTPAGSC